MILIMRHNDWANGLTSVLCDLVMVDYNKLAIFLAIAQSSKIMSMTIGTYPDSLVAWAKLIKRRQITVRVFGWCAKKTLDEREINRQIYDEAKKLWDISEKNFLAGFG